ncbi:MAG: hypothetical protein ACXWAY_18930, partial [Acidimicrobiia bacterium]
MRRAMLTAITATAVTLAIAVAAPLAGSAVPTKAPADPSIVFSGEGNNLNAYQSTPPFRRQRVITTRADDPKGLDINAQICFFPGTKRGGTRWFIAGEDTGQPNPPQGWGIFELRGHQVGKLHAKKIGKLTPTYQGSLDNAENYGCGFLKDGRVLTTDVGNQASGDGDGQLIVWFPPFNRTKVKYCKIDTGLATAGGILVRNDQIYVASARPPTAGVWRYTGPFPTSNTAAGGCGGTDATGAPTTDAVHKEIFIPAGGPIATPNAIAPSPRGFYISSVISGVIAEFDRNGTYLRNVLEPAAGDTLGAAPYRTGTPLGLGVDRKGDIFYADIGIVVDAKGVGPGDNTGTVRRIHLVNG